MKLGFPPVAKTCEVVDVNVKHGTETLDLLLILDAFNETNNAKIPEFTEIPYLHP